MVTEIGEIRMNNFIGKKNKRYSNWNLQNNAIFNYSRYFFQYFYFNWKFTLNVDFKNCGFFL